MSPLLAATGGDQISYRLARAQNLTEWWHWLLLAALCGAVAGYVIWMYRRDGVEMSAPMCGLLAVLRILAFAGLLIFFLDLERRSERSVVMNSRLAVLIDTSQSMALPDSGASTDGPSRIDRVRAELMQGTLLKSLRASHDLVVYRFDQGARPIEIGAFPKTAPDRSAAEMLLAGAGNGGTVSRPQGPAPLARGILMLALALLGVALAASIVTMLSRGAPAKSGDRQSWSLLVAVLGALIGLFLFAAVNLRHPALRSSDLWELLAQGTVPLEVESERFVKSADETLQTGAAGGSQEPAINWEAELKATGLETRLGDALRFVINKERGGPIAGIVLFTDGAHNAGSPIGECVGLARQAGIPIYAVGLGSDRRPTNLRVVDFEAPPRVYPGDRFSTTGFLQAHGLAGRTVRVELVSRAADKGQTVTAERFEQEQRVKLGADGEIITVKFDVAPQEQGRREFRLRVAVPEEDRDPSDNEKSAAVQVVERRTRVLLIAGGPSRDFQFLRNMLHRDREVDVDVWLQSGKPGISQDADQLVFEFPKTAEELFRYDAIVAFDADWTELDELQVELLIRWVAENSGGLVVLAGPVNTPRWASRIRGDARLDKIQELYPVVFYSRGAATLSLGKFGSTSPWPLQFTRDGLEAEFLWLDDTALGSEQAWAGFPGFFGYYAVKGVKPGARVFARFSDPDASLDGEMPVYMAGHFYGAGRVFFMASGEIWRLRGLDDKYFDLYYTKLIRWVSQGRLLRDSSRGVILVEKDRCLQGDDVEIRAILTDSQHRPLAAETVTATATHDDGTRVDLVLRRLKDSPREGSFIGTLSAQKVGDYRIELRPPEARDDEVLRRELRVLAPQLETERPERNDALLAELAQKSDGQYYVGLDAAMGRGADRRAAVASVIDPRDRVTFLPGTPDRDFDRRLMTWLMGFLCSVLCLEWLIRRLNRLA